MLKHKTLLQTADRNAGFPQGLKPDDLARCVAAGLKSRPFKALGWDDTSAYHDFVCGHRSENRGNAIAGIGGEARGGSGGDSYAAGSFAGVCISGEADADFFGGLAGVHGGDGGVPPGASLMELRR